MSRSSHGRGKAQVKRLEPLIRFIGQGVPVEHVDAMCERLSQIVTRKEAAAIAGCAINTILNHARLWDEDYELPADLRRGFPSFTMGSELFVSLPHLLEWNKRREKAAALRKVL